MTDEERARKLQNDPALEKALVALVEVASEGDPSQATGRVGVMLGMVAFSTMALLLQAKGIAPVEESVMAFVAATEEAVRQMREQSRLASILGQQ